jgi:pentose-5-phosphate-3-epimerase
MLTLQAAATASRTDHPGSMLAAEQVEAYLVRLSPTFRGTIQLQGGITTRTVATAVHLGARFLVCGTEIFHNQAGLPAQAVIDRLLQVANAALNSSSPRAMT